MVLIIEQTQILNPINDLTAHRVSAKIPVEILEDNLNLTAALFPQEPNASVGLRKAYQALLSGSPIIDDCELLEYFIYTTKTGEAATVIAGSGLYRLVAENETPGGIIEVLQLNPPRNVHFLKGNPLKLSQLIWGGRLGIEPSAARSSYCMPFIIHHILETATKVIRTGDFAPILLAFTQRDDNARVHKFYEHLGFEKTETSLEFAGEIQDVFALDLSESSTVLRRLMRLTSKRL
jgi:hypothetical protein